MTKKIMRPSPFQREMSISNSKVRGCLQGTLLLNTNLPTPVCCNSCVSLALSLISILSQPACLHATNEPVKKQKGWYLESFIQSLTSTCTIRKLVHNKTSSKGA